MDLKDYIRNQLSSAKRATTRAIDGLSNSELAWRPGPGCNSIGLILFHQTRWEDTFVQATMQGKPQVWELERWYQKLNLPVGDTGSHYTAEQVDSFPVPELKDLLGYADAVRARTLEYLSSMTLEEFDKTISMPRLGDVTIGALFGFTVVHLAEHAGEISYLRGIQRGMDK